MAPELSCSGWLSVIWWSRVEGAVRSLPGVVVDEDAEDAAAWMGDEEEHVEAPQQDRLDGEEVAGDNARACVAQEVTPSWANAARSRLNAGTREQSADAGRRHCEAELGQLAADPSVTPARVLPREPQHQLLDLGDSGGRPPRPAGCRLLRRTNAWCRPYWRGRWVGRWPGLLLSTSRFERCSGR
jgi:hypothetical protein